MNKIGLFSVPRSGSSWLGEIMNSSPEVLYKFQPNFAYSFSYCLDEHSNLSEIDNFYNQLLATKDAFVNGKLSISGQKREFHFKKNMPETLLFKETHYLNILPNLLKVSDTKIIGLVRSPFAVINSWLKIPKEFDPSWNVKEEWLNANKKNEGKSTHYFGYNKWKEATFLFLDLKKQYPEQFYLVNYKNLITETQNEIKQLFKFCDLEYTRQTESFIEQSTSSTSTDAYHVFKQKKDDLDWKKTLPKFIEDGINADEDFNKLNQSFKWSI
ncbi:sulfotransferase domain-containing protein [Psychroflexus sp. ALD_RP9]|uniref:sulfotransferase domain-containing protein n=1 Tax=Psychroflexus sp. ALD_RP9 TaxID=2777186 RepID=UPI001A8CFA11|nr:sulfotransferase domain-containing protein [Psychroflexus sp. ALD_RP9]QSS96387.1 sulfotransferase domain-containing protein [Psychroflexus sp. ALD_RP9]